MKTTWMIRCPSASFGERADGAFTRIELVVVLAVLLVVAPLLAATHYGSRAAVCLNNMRQLAAAMALYTANSNDYLPPNPDDGNQMSGYNWCAGTVTNPNDATNLTYLTNAKYNSLAPFLDGNVRVFKCPEDQRLVNIGSTVTPTVRSYSLNNAVGTIDPSWDAGGPHSGAPTLSVNGPWLDGSHSHTRNNPYATYGKVIDFPKPSQVFTFIDEDPTSINDGTFALSAAVAKWVDYPSAGHDRGGTLAFADGHAELRHWLVDSTRVIGGNVAQRNVSSDPRDWQWLSERATQKYLAK